MAKNWQDLLDHETLKSGVSHKWLDELSRLIEWFLHADFDGIITGLTANSNAWSKLYLYLLRMFFF